MDISDEARAEPWFAQWERDHAQLLRDFQAYELYRLEPFEGREIHIGADGRRASVPNRAVGAQPTPLRVELFGGSTMWGSLVRDSQTIPSLMLSELHARLPARTLEVQNSGEIGFVLSQEYHRAIRHLYSSSERPDMMIFLDGVNDSLSALTAFGHGLTEVAGLPWEVEKYRYLFKMGNTGEITFVDVLKKSKAFRLGWKLLAQAKVVKPDPKMVWNPPSASDFESISDAVADTYLRMVQSAHQTLSASGIIPVFLLQPMLQFKHTLTPSEVALYEKNTYWQPYVRMTYDKIRTRSERLGAGVRFYDLSRALEQERGTQYWDVLHYSESGNAVLAKRIAEIVSPLLKEPTHPNLQHLQ